jgi:hypothetical protein
VDEFITLKAQSKDIEGRLKLVETNLKQVARREFFAQNEHSDRPDGTFEMHGHTASVKVSFQDRYYPITICDDTRPNILEIRRLCQGQFNSLFTEDSVLTISFSQVAEGTRQQFTNELVSLLNIFGIANAVELKETVVPLKDVFHARRHTVLTPKENEELHQLVPCTVSIR